MASCQEEAGGALLDAEADRNVRKKTAEWSLCLVSQESCRCGCFVGVAP